MPHDWKDAIRVPSSTGPADVIHDFAPPSLLNRPTHAAADVGERFVPRHAAPGTRSARAVALQRIQDAVRIFELIRRAALAHVRPRLPGWTGFSSIFLTSSVSLST